MVGGDVVVVEAKNQQAIAFQMFSFVDCIKFCASSHVNLTFDIGIISTGWIVGHHNKNDF